SPPLAGLVIATLAMPFAAVAQDRVVPDTYLAVTTNMQPAEVQLKADVIRWSSAEERAAVIAALDSDEPAAALKDLPTMGVVWRENSAVGNSIKYAYRTGAEDGERVTLVTEKQIGYTSFKPWAAENPADEVSTDYTVIEMNVGEGGSGLGTMSLGANVSIDRESDLISLAADDAEPLLTNVRMAPKPYWANAD
ncbi:MAG: hypothetical protein PVH89_07170, partial [Gammaproteobacteria bacterium]